MAAPDVSKILTGPWRATLGAQHLGDVSPDGINVAIDSRTRERMVDRFGESLITLVDMGARAEITLTMMEWVQENIAAALPTAYDGSTYVTLGRRPGHKYSDDALALVLHPINAGDAVTTEDITIYKAVCTGSFPIPLGSANDKVLAVTFTALLDPNRAELDRLMKIAAAARG